MRQPERTLVKIVDKITKVSLLVSDIASANGEQAAGIEPVNSVVTQIEGMTQKSASQREKMNTASRAIEEQTLKRVKLASFFKTSSPGTLVIIDFSSDNINKLHHNKPGC